MGKSEFIAVISFPYFFSSLPNSLFFSLCLPPIEQKLDIYRTQWTGCEVTIINNQGVDFIIIYRI